MAASRAAYRPDGSPACEVTSAWHTSRRVVAPTGRQADLGHLVAVAPEGGIREETRWLTGALVVQPKPGDEPPKGHITLRRPISQKPLVVRVAKRDGRYGIGLDDDQRIVEPAGRVGDRRRRQGGRPDRPCQRSPDPPAEDLAKQCEGRDQIELTLGVDNNDGGVGGGDADGDGEVDEGAAGTSFSVPPTRCCRCTCGHLGRGHDLPRDLADVVARFMWQALAPKRAAASAHPAPRCTASRRPPAAARSVARHCADALFAPARTAAWR